jgi:hypothetical protein
MSKLLYGASMSLDGFIAGHEAPQATNLRLRVVTRQG